MSHLMIRTCLALVCLTIFTSGFVIRDKRESETQLICSYSQPCAWEVYKPFTRETQYFLDNICVCSRGLDCVKDGDDLSVTAYVYRCRNSARNS